MILGYKLRSHREFAQNAEIFLTYFFCRVELKHVENICRMLKNNISPAESGILLLGKRWKTCTKCWTASGIWRR